MRLRSFFAWLEQQLREHPEYGEKYLAYVDVGAGAQFDDLKIDVRTEKNYDGTDRDEVTIDG